MPIVIEELRKAIEKDYIGFRPNTHQVKPAHIANGLYRATLEGTTKTGPLFRFIFTEKENGVVPRGHELSKVYEELLAEKRIADEGVGLEDVKRLRALLRKVVAADKAVFTTGMESYSAGAPGFVSKDRVGQEGGEFVAQWLRYKSSPLRDCLLESLNQAEDVITLLCAPLLEQKSDDFTSNIEISKVRLFAPETSLPAPCVELWAGLEEAAKTLALHLDAHPNKLYRLRLIVLFSAFVLVRHLACLESYYVPEARVGVLPFLLDFSQKSDDPVARASSFSYALACQSLGRFYTWGFCQKLKETCSWEDLKIEPPPTYEGANKKSSTKGASGSQIRDVWQQTLKAAEGQPDPFIQCGEALYDLLATEGNANPIGYMRQLGNLSGLFWPPVNAHPNKILRVGQDMLETLVRGAVAPGETLDLPELQARLWTRYGILVGGRTGDAEKLVEAGIYQADNDALQKNRQHFAEALQGLDFARLLADGVLQVEMAAVSKA